MREIRDSTVHFFVDDMNAFQGEYKSWHVNGELCSHRYYVDDKLHGERKSWYDNGVLSLHEYNVNGVVVHDFIESPLSNIEKMILVLKYGAPLLDNSGHSGTIAQ